MMRDYILRFVVLHRIKYFSLHKKSLSNEFEKKLVCMHACVYACMCVCNVCMYVLIDV